MPGSSILQFTSLSVQLAGIVLVSLSPVPLGPRKRVHSWAAAELTKARTNNDESVTRRMGKTLKQAGDLGGNAYQDVDVSPCMAASQSIRGQGSGVRGQGLGD